MPDYVVAGNAAVDHITFSDGSTTGFLPGGATLFALTGIQLWTDSVLLCGGFGADYMEHMGEWLTRCKIDRRGFHVRDPRNPLNYMFYQPDGQWTTRTEYGNEHYDSLDCDPQKDGLERFLPGAKGVCTFRDDNPGFFAQMAELHKKYGFKFMWEIKATVTIPEKLSRIRELLAQIEGFSINRPEAYRLFGVKNDADACRALADLGCGLVVYRVGEEGLYILLPGQTLFAPSFSKYPVEDVTGCGNTSTSAAFYAWCEGLDIYDIAATANVTSGLNLRYRGAMELSPALRSLAQQERAAFSEQLRQTQEVRG